jgi:hypothetical protein
MARELMEVTLDLHGLALAQMTAAIIASEGGENLMQKLLATPHVRAILLLHGLHPEEPEQRLRQAIEAMREQWRKRGVDVVLLRGGSGSAHVQVCRHSDQGSAADLRQEIEDILADAAPDLDEIVVEIAVAAPAPALALSAGRR